MDFELVGPIRDIQTIAVGRGIRGRARLRRCFGRGRCTFCGLRQQQEVRGLPRSRKLYRIIPDEEAESHGYLRVVDESGEDYGYAADRFFPLDVPRALADALRMAM